MRPGPGPWPGACPPPPRGSRRGPGRPLEPPSGPAGVSPRTHAAKPPLPEASMSQDTKTLLEWSNKYLFQNYGRAPLCLIRGEGARVWDTDGKEYLDFVGGIAVDALGHSHPKIVGAIREQATALLQVSNLYQIPSQIHLAKLLVRPLVRRPRVLLQLRHGGERGRDQARPEVREGDARHRRGRHHHDAGRLPRPDARRALAPRRTRSTSTASSRWSPASSTSRSAT